jgi:dCMP deaminase
MTIERISRDELLIGIARLVSQRGTCIRLKVGALIARDGRPLSIGYNGAPAKLEHCNPVRCDVNKPCTWSSHAETNAITYAAKKGIATEGAIMYCTDSPCETCAKAIINAGITRVVYVREYRNTSGLKLLDMAGVWHDQFMEPK